MKMAMRKLSVLVLVLVAGVVTFGCAGGGGHERTVLVKDTDREIKFTLPSSFEPAKQKGQFHSKELKLRLNKTRAYRRPTVEIKQTLEEARQKVNSGKAKAATKLLKGLKKGPELPDKDARKELRQHLSAIKEALAGGKLSEASAQIDKAVSFVDTECKFPIHQYSEYHAKKGRALNMLSSHRLVLPNDRQGCVVFISGHKVNLRAESGDDVLDLSFTVGKGQQEVAIETLKGIAASMSP